MITSLKFIFYAHTISPIAIAFCVSSFMCFYIGNISFYAGIIAFISYCFLAIGIPIIISPKVEKIALNYRNKTGDCEPIKIFDLKYRATAALFFSNLEMCFKTS